MNRKVFPAFIPLLLLFNPAISYSQEKLLPVHTDPGYSCFQNPDKTWGFDITRSGKTFIHQPTIPAVAGLKGFKDKSSAVKVAKLAIDKLKAKPNDFPSISVEELKKLKIIQD
jgi:Domain of unknown function (DUF4907)